MKRRLLATVFVGALCAPLPALAQNNVDDWSGEFGKKAERRSDFVLGFSTGLVLGAASGYPNEIDKLNVPGEQARTGLSLGPGGEAWIGGALTDWFTFGLGGAYLSGKSADGRASGGAFLVRVETYPFYKLGLKDLAVFANFGAGSLAIHEDSIRGKRRGTAGLASIGGGGVAYEVARFWHIAFAPTAEYLYIASQSLTAHQAVLGARLVFYGGPS
jgi:hypothetical protein